MIRTFCSCVSSKLSMKLLVCDPQAIAAVAAAVDKQAFSRPETNRKSTFSLVVLVLSSGAFEFGSCYLTSFRTL